MTGETTLRELDLPLCLASGMSFRFSRTGPGTWEGVDGDAWFEITLPEALAGPPMELGTGMGAVARGFLDEPYRFSWTTNQPEALPSLLRLETRLTDLHQELARRGPELGPTLARMSGLRLLRRSDPVETLYTFLLTANNHLPRITGLVGRVAELGEPFPERPHLRRWPSLGVLTGVPESWFRERGFGYRAKPLAAMGRALTERGGEAWLQSLAGASYEVAHRGLVELPGIGPKLADCVLMLGLDHGKAAPLDTHVYHAVARLYRPEWIGSALTGPRYREGGALLRDRFGGLAAWAQQVLFTDELLNWRSRRLTIPDDTR